MSIPILFIVLAIYAFFLIAYWSLLIRRAHDLGYSGWMTLLYLIPFVNFIMLIYFFFARGTEGANVYGSPNIGKPFWSSVLGKEVGLPATTTEVAPSNVVPPTAQ